MHIAADWKINSRVRNQESRAERTPDSGARWLISKEKSVSLQKRVDSSTILELDFWRQQEPVPPKVKLRKIPRLKMRSRERLRPNMMLQMIQNKRLVASRAPSPRLLIFSHAICPSTAPKPANVAKPQSVPAITRSFPTSEA